ncbi:MAG TPA: hypothetical protein VLM11_18915 [Streptosporangiaceae bacterium]|nr:hypothetical protein [Streptosporangiaceae bacterium]
MSSVGSDLVGNARVNEPTLADVWHSMSGEPISPELLEWPPDLFALTNVILERSEAFRFALPPNVDWPPPAHPNWAMAVEEAGRQWSAWAQSPRGAIPDLVQEQWTVTREGADTPLDEVARGSDWGLCEALLTLHAVADEACAGLGVALDSSDGTACVYRARGRELLGRTGTLARVSPRFLRVLPKVCTPPTGRAAFSRYACVQGPGIDARWRKVPARHRGTDVTSEYATMLLLPWPMQVRASDFQPVEGSVARPAKDPYGFFEFAPAERLDFDLLDRVLVAARQEVNSVDVVILPESAVDEDEISTLEDLLHSHGAITLMAGVRQKPQQPGRLPGNWIHMGFNPQLEKGSEVVQAAGAPWFHVRQNKHHRWSLDKSQILQYHLGGVLHPDVLWWEAMDVPRLGVEFIEVAELTMVSSVCEDLAQNDNVAAVMRSVGPTVVITVLLDGPQLSSRWAARYASVLADDPGSAVLTLTSVGMAGRSRPPGREASPVIALWKDPSGGIREIPLERGAHAVVLSVCMDRATRRSADGRWPVDNGTSCYDVAVQQLHAASAGSGFHPQAVAESVSPLLTVEELTILTAWAEGVAETLCHAPAATAWLLAEALPGASWRDVFGLAPPSARLGQAIDLMRQHVLTCATVGGTPGFVAVLDACEEDRPDETQLDALVRRVLRAMLEERRTRQPSGRPSAGI